MINKISKVEKFLWGLYKIYEVVGDILNMPPRNICDAVYPECKKLRQKYQTEKDRKMFRNLIYYLKNKGLIKEFKEGERLGWLLTSLGEERILEIKKKENFLKKRKDGKWIMVIFDIPEKLKSKRESFRRKLRFLGFKMLQKSIWICPLDVLKEINNFSDKNFLNRHIRAFLIEEI